MNEITPQKAIELLRSEGSHCVLIDVRAAAEFESLHATDAIHIPLERITESETVQKLRGKKVLCICQSGMRGRQAAQALSQQGISDVSNVDGGTAAWHRANLPVVTGRITISIERQVRIAAGSLIVLGSLGAIFVSPFLLAVPLFVGAGLVFSGITDTCGMALLLARCPWNSR